MRHLASSLLLASLGAFALGAQPIQYVDSRKLFLLTTRDSSYAMGVDLNGELQHLYWGAALWRAGLVRAGEVQQVDHHDLPVTAAMGELGELLSRRRDGHRAPSLCGSCSSHRRS